MPKIISTFLGSKSHSPNGSCDFTDPKKVSIHVGPIALVMKKIRLKKIMHGSVKFIDALIVITVSPINGDGHTGPKV